MVIEAMRRVLEISEFSEEGCAKGLIHLGEYEAFEYDTRLESTKQSRSHHKHSNAADAFRQLAQEYHYYTAYRARKKKGRGRSWKTV